MSRLLSLWYSVFLCFLKVLIKGLRQTPPSKLLLSGQINEKVQYCKIAEIMTRTMLISYHQWDTTYCMSVIIAYLGRVEISAAAERLFGSAVGAVLTINVEVAAGRFVGFSRL